MEPQNDAATSLLRLPDRIYFEFGETDQDKLLDALIVMNDFEGTVIGVPASLDVDARDRLLLLWLRRTSGLRNWQVEVMRNSTVVVSDLIRGRISLHDAFAGPKRIDLRQVSYSKEGDPPASDEAESVTVSAEMLDLRSIANLPWQTGRFAITMIVYDWVSNAVVVELEGAGPEPQEILPQRPSDFLISTSASTETPKIESPGAALSVPGNVQETAPFLIHGAVSIPLERVAVIPAASSKHASLIMVSVLLLKRDERQPVQIDLLVPATIRGESRSDKMAEAFFSVDVRSGLSGRVLSGTYQVYLVVGDRVAGPYPMTVGTP